jgi:hypothetical protein
MLKKLYVKGSLVNTDTGFQLKLKNTLAPGTIIGVSPLTVDGTVYPTEKITVSSQSKSTAASDVKPDAPFTFGVGNIVTLEVEGDPLEGAEHTLAIAVNTQEVGELDIEVTDTFS